MESLHLCPRYYELISLTPPDDELSDTIDLKFGDVVGFGIQRLLLGDKLETIWLKMMLRWHIDLYAFEDEHHIKKTFFHAMIAVEKFVGFRKTDLDGWELAVFDGVPAIELSVLIDLGDGFQLQQHIDAVLVNKRDKMVAVMEGKTTKFKMLNEAAYKNSNQGLGYGVSLDAIVHQVGVAGIKLGSSYKVLYPVWKTAENGAWQLFEFPKGFTKRALYIKDILIDKQHIIEYAADEYFPMHGSWDTCFRFFRPCRFFGICELSNKALGLADAPERIENPDDYQFNFKLIDLINAQLAKQDGE